MNKYIASFILLFITWVFGLTYYLQIRNLAPEDKRIVEVLLSLFGIVLAYRTFVTIREYLREKSLSSKGENTEGFEKIKDLLQRKESQFILVTVPYIALFETVGFFTSSFFYLFGANILLGIKGIGKQILIPLGVCFFVYVVFVGIFGIRLPEGVLF